MIPNQIDNNDVKILYSTDDLQGEYIYLEDDNGERRMVPEVMFNKDGNAISIDKEKESVQPQDRWITKCMSEVASYKDDNESHNIYLVRNIGRPNTVGILCDRDNLRIPEQHSNPEFFY